MRITCEDTRDRLDAYGAGDLTGGEQMQVRTHLTACRICQDHLADGERVTRAVRHAMTVVPPPGYLESLPARLEAGRFAGTRTASPWLRAAPYGLAAAALVVLLLARPVWNASRTDVTGAFTFAPTAQVTVKPTATTDAQASGPRVGRSVEKHGDLMRVQLVMVGPHAVTPSTPPIPHVAMARSKGPLMNSSRIEQLIATILRPRRDAARATGQGFDVDLYASAEAVVLARQATYASRSAGNGGLAAFVSGSASVIADVTLPLY